MAAIFWEELVRTALVGTNRKQVSPALRSWLKDRKIDLPVEPGRALLAACGAYRLLQQAAAAPFPLSGQVPKKVGKASEDTSAHLIEITNHLMKEPYRAILPEFVRRCEDMGRELPAGSVPFLLEKALKDAELRALLPTLTGELGRWLTHQNPEWFALQWDATFEEWPRLSEGARFGLLIQLRDQNPSKVSDHLVSVWPELSWKERVRFLGTFSRNSSADDLPFLEMAIRDTRLEVRKKAAELLLLCPESGEADRAWENAFELVKWKGRTLEIELPEGQNPYLQEYRLQDSAMVQGLSLRQSWLFFRLSTLPVSTWNLERSPEEWLNGAVDHNEGGVVLRAWWVANIRDRDPEWDKAWLNLLLDLPELPDWVIKEEITILTSGIPERIFNRSILPAINKSSGLIREGSSVHQILLHGLHTWNEQVSWAVLWPFQEYVENTESFYWDSWHYRDFLRKASVCIWPGLAEELGQNWGGGMISWGMWEKEVLFLLDIVSFRERMHQALEASIT